MRKTRWVLLALLFVCSIAITSSSAQPSISAIVSEAAFGKMFPQHANFYSYQGFIAGGDATEDFCASGTTATRIRECAAFLAIAAHETGAGRYIREQIASNKCSAYSDRTQKGACAPAPGQCYYGRGWMHLTWNYNYCGASKSIYHDDGSTLVQTPNILETDPVISTQASLWYWMTQDGGSPMSPHDCMINGKGFGCTIRAINGDLECNGQNRAEVRSRVNYYLSFLKILSNGTVSAVGPNNC